MANNCEIDPGPLARSLIYAREQVIADLKAFCTGLGMDRLSRMNIAIALREVADALEPKDGACAANEESG